MQKDESTAFPFGIVDLVIFDLETTGLDGSKCEIIEIAALRLRGGLVIEEFQSLVKPQGKIPPNIINLTGINDEMIKDAPSEDSVLSDFLDFIEDSTLCAHNSDFDTGFLRRRLEAWEMPNFFNSTLDTLALARILYPGLRNHRLSTVTNLFGTEVKDAHRAMADVRAIASFLPFLWQRMLSLPSGLLSQLTHIMRYSSYAGASDAFSEALSIRSRMKEPPESPPVDTRLLLDLTNTMGKKDTAKTAFDAKDVRLALSDDGKLPDILPRF
jgi:DNA polymerase III epsilon subunit family exonuclease